jgi:hypothetical protein
MMDASGLLRRSSCRAREDYDRYDTRENRDPGSGSIRHALNAIGKSLQGVWSLRVVWICRAILSSGQNDSDLDAGGQQTFSRGAVDRVRKQSCPGSRVAGREPGRSVCSTRRSRPIAAARSTRF